MHQEDKADTQQPDLEPTSPTGNEDTGISNLDATRGLSLGGLLAGLLGNAGSPSEAGAPAAGGGGLGDLLGAVLGGGDTVDLSDQAGELGVPPAALQTIVPLVVGTLLRGGQAEAGVSRAALDDLARGKAGAADALLGTGLLQEIMRRTGLDQKGALAIITAVLKALGLGRTSTSKPKPKPKPKPSLGARPKPKPRPSASAKPKPKPKPAASAGTKPKPKPRPKPSANAKPKSKPKAKPKPKSKRTGEVDLGGETSQDDAAA